MYYESWYLAPYRLAFKNFLFPSLDIKCGFIDSCHDNATCSDENGSYTCVCKRGFTGDGFNCTGEPLKFDYINVRVITFLKKPKYNLTVK